jgi:hypothetical protein
MKKLSLLVFLVGLTATLSAQPGPPPPDPGEPVPISGIEILMGAGALLGGRHLLKRKKS